MIIEVVIEIGVLTNSKHILIMTSDQYSNCVLAFTRNETLKWAKEVKNDFRNTGIDSRRIFLRSR